jgi:hypothetical protein
MLTDFLNINPMHDRWVYYKYGCATSQVEAPHPQNATPFEFACILDFAQKRFSFTDGSVSGYGLIEIYCVDCIRNKFSV